MPRVYADSPSVYHLYVIRVEAQQREAFCAHMKQLGIETGIHYPFALSKLKAATEVMGIHADCPEAEQASREVVSLPVYPEMTEEMLDYICDGIHNFFK